MDFKSEEFVISAEYIAIVFFLLAFVLFILVKKMRVNILNDKEKNLRF